MFDDPKGHYWAIYQRLASYYEQHDAPVALDELEAMHLSSLGGASEAKVEALKEVYKGLQELPDTQAGEFLLEQVRRRGILLAAAADLADAIDNDDEAAALKASLMLQSLEEVDELEDSLLYTISLMDAQEDYQASQKWHWLDDRLNALVKGGGPGRNSLIVALTNVGKTSFIVGNAVGFMRQGAKVLHCSIAEDSKVSLQRRYYQAALNKNDEELDADIKGATAEFLREFGGKLYLAPVDALTVGALEKLVKDIKPDVVILDDFKDLDLGKKSDMRMDKLYGSLAVRIKSMGIKHDFFTVCACQASDSATGKKRLTRQDVSDSKVDIPGKFQYAIGLTRGQNDTTMRYVSLIKNKMGSEEEILALKLDEPRCQWRAL